MTVKGQYAKKGESVQRKMEDEEMETAISDLGFRAGHVSRLGICSTFSACLG